MACGDPQPQGAGLGFHAAPPGLGAEAGVGAPPFGGFQALEIIVLPFGEASVAASSSRALAPEPMLVTGLSRAAVARTYDSSPHDH
eukprot:4148141-Alexandrium_andersonii.AAC.1